MSFQPEYDSELNTKDLENFLSFPTDINTHSGNQRFKSYDLWKLSDAIRNFCPGQNEVIFLIWNFSIFPDETWGNY
jgi:hypothetical protein